MWDLPLFDQTNCVTLTFDTNNFFQELQTSQCSLGCVVELIHLILLLSDAPQQEAKTFRAAMPPFVFDSDDQASLLST